MKYVMTLEHCPNPDIGGYYQYPVDKKPIKAIGSIYKEMRDKFCDWIHRNDLGSGNVPWTVVSVIGKDKLIKPVARFSANGRLWELDDNDDSFNSSDPREICIDIDDDKETMDKYAIGEIKAVEPEPVKAYPEYTGIISQLTESLDCDADEIVNIVNLLNMTEYWVENKMLDVCEDNDVMRKVLWADLQEFIQKYKPQNLSVEELYVTDKSEED